MSGGHYEMSAPALLDEVVPNTSVWLAGPPSSRSELGIRGYRYPSFDGGPTPMSLDAHCVILYVSGTTLIERRTATAEFEKTEVGPGDISLQPSQLAAVWKWNNPIDVLHVYVDPAYLDAIVADQFGHGHAVQMRHGLRINDDQLVQMGVELIQELAEPRRLASSRMLRLTGERLAIHLLRQYFTVVSEQVRAHGLSTRQVGVLNAFLDTNLHDRVQVDDMARRVGLGVHHFARLCRETFDRGPHEYLRDRRLERAHQFVTTTTRPIADIAVATGFADQSHLTRCFKARYGLPPAAFRRPASTNPFKS